MKHLDSCKNRIRLELEKTDEGKARLNKAEERKKREFETRLKEYEDQGKKRKVYSLTNSGKRSQVARTKEWQRFTAAVESILKECGDE